MRRSTSRLWDEGKGASSESPSRTRARAAQPGRGPQHDRDALFGGAFGGKKNLCGIDKCPLRYTYIPQVTGGLPALPYLDTILWLSRHSMPSKAWYVLRATNRDKPLHGFMYSLRSKPRPAIPGRQLAPERGVVSKVSTVCRQARE
eukprot:scaffold4744_cov426-Prasinococcus_capsulatus_cf.AAC.7